MQYAMGLKPWDPTSLHDTLLRSFSLTLNSLQVPYDNSCKLHKYILNRQLSHFQNTNFFVDWFHWRGHVGCPSGYSLDKYTTSDIATINSQVNEQANAGLQQVKGQIAYMKPENFVSCETVLKYNEHGQKS